jgi:uncharacterized protein YyaL (SSP411 family)
MNQVFVSVKVDREERPDLDHVYMSVCQLLTGRGGWPLTLVLTPDKRPFFAATYIPKETRFGQPGMLELVPRIGEVWKNRRKDVIDSAESIAASLKALEKDLPGGALDMSIIDQAYTDLAERYDRTYGGFGTAPKFPSPHNFLFLLRYWKRTGKEDALRMVEKTLQEIRRGGIYDHVGFGVHRYSTDREWLIPHFEKMLYDQAMLALAYLEVYQATGKRMYERTAREIFEYVLRDLRDPEGGFYSAEDADSEGEEGKFYVWKEEEIRDVLEPGEAELAIRVFQVRKEGNFQEEASGRKQETNILYTARSRSEIGSGLDLPPSDLDREIEAVRVKLFEAREGRVHPYKDDKILTDWNGLIIAALARGAQVLGDEYYRKAAEDGVRFILQRLRQEDGRLLHRYREGEASIQAHLDDYAFLVWGLIELYEATFDPSFLKTALDLNEDMLRRFWDHEGAGFFFTPEDGETLIIRKKEYYDSATPSGNSIAMYNLLRLARLTGRTALEEKAAALASGSSGVVRQYPSGFTQLLSAIDFGIGPTFEVVIVGAPGAPDTNAMVHALRGSYLPNQVTIFKSSSELHPEIDRVAEFVESHNALGGKTTAYVCSANACSAPTTDPGEMLEKIVYR